MFLTKNGRKVYDGGGVEPDVTIEKPKRTLATKALYRSDAVFKYATKYQYDKETIATADKFELESNTFSNFVSFLKSEKTSFKTKTEKEFEKAFEKAEKEEVNNVIKNNYENLLNDLEKSENKRLAKK